MQYLTEPEFYALFVITSPSLGGRGNLFDLSYLTGRSLTKHSYGRISGDDGYLLWFRELYLFDGSVSNEMSI